MFRHLDRGCETLYRRGFIIFVFFYFYEKVFIFFIFLDYPFLGVKPRQIYLVPDEPNNGETSDLLNLNGYLNKYGNYWHALSKTDLRQQCPTYCPQAFSCPPSLFKMPTRINFNIVITNIVKRVLTVLKPYIN